MTVERTRSFKVPPGMFVPEIENDLTRREFLIGTGLIVLAPGCGSGGEGEATSEEGSVISHELGETRVPEKPTRIVTLTPAETEIAIALGVKPVGAAVADPAIGFPGHLEEETEGIEIVGTYTEPNLEAIARLEPDLVVGPTSFMEMIYDELSEIAPTVATQSRSFWKEENLPLMGRALGRLEEAERFLAEYEESIEELRAALDRPPEEISVSVIATADGGDLNVYLKRSPAGIILDDVGFSRPPIQDEALVDGSDFITISEERFPSLDADAIFIIVSDEEVLERIQTRLVWRRLEAVRRGKVYRADRGHWFTGGPLSAQEMISDIFESLVEENG